MTNSAPLETAFQRIQRQLLASTFNTKQTSDLIDSIYTDVETLTPLEVNELISIAKNDYQLRTAPLVLAIIANKFNLLINPKATFESLLVQPNLLQTALDIYHNINGYSVKPLANPLKKALASKIVTFQAFNLIKGNTKVNDFTLADVIKLTHPKPINEDQEILFKQIIERNTPTIDTWETAISAAKTPQEKTQEWSRLLHEGKLNNLTLLRNLNNLINNHIPLDEIVLAINTRIDLQKVNLFQLLNSILNIEQPKVIDAIQGLIDSNSFGVTLPKETLIILDTSGSMSALIDYNSRTSKTRVMISYMLAYYLAKVSEKYSLILTATSHTISDLDVKKLSFKSFIQAIELQKSSCGFGGIYTRRVIEWAKPQGFANYHRTVVISDSEDCDGRSTVAEPFTPYSYLLDISRNSNNIVFNQQNWTAQINGWSELLPNFIQEYETVFS